MPRCWLWITLFKVGEQGGVREVLEARRVIGHGVGVSGEVLSSVAVAVKALVGTCIVAERCCGIVGGDCSFSNSRHGGSVAAEVFHCGIGQVTGRGHQVYLSQEGSMFQVAISDVPSWVGV